jgi:DNA polymerase
MNKQKEISCIAAEIQECLLCKKGGTGKPVTGEGSPDALVMFIGEAPGREEAEIGRPFVGRSGKFLRTMIREIGLGENDIFITSPGHYRPLRRTPSRETVLHGREHTFRQLSIIDPKIVVLLGGTACLAMLDEKVDVVRKHGSLVRKNGRSYFITFHPAYAMRFPEGKKGFMRDFQKLKRLMGSSGEGHAR